MAIRTTSFTAAVCGAALALGACATFTGEQGAGGPAAQSGSASNDAGGATAQTQQLSAQDREFVTRAAQSGLAEVESSRIAVTQATSEEVRAYAQRMVRDHSATNEELMRLARGKGIEVSPMLDAEHRAQVDALQAKSGADFDRAYLQDMGVRAHQDAVSLFERQARDGSDPDLRAFAARTLVGLREHLAMAEQAAAVAATQ